MGGAQTVLLLLIGNRCGKQIVRQFECINVWVHIFSLFLKLCTIFNDLSYLNLAEYIIYAYMFDVRITCTR